MKKLRNRERNHEICNSGRNKFRRRLGFTLTEVLIVVAILGVLAGVGIPGIAALRNRLQLRALDDCARQIFVAAQNGLTAADAAGKLEDYKTPENPAEGFQAKKWLNADSDELDVFFDFEKIKGAVGTDAQDKDGQFYSIHVDYDTASVLEVLYTEDAAASLYGHEEESYSDTYIHPETNELSYRDNSAARVTKTYKIGQYDSTDIEGRSKVKYLPLNVIVENDLELKLNAEINPYKGADDFSNTLRDEINTDLNGKNIEFVVKIFELDKDGKHVKEDGADKLKKFEAAEAYRQIIDLENDIGADFSQVLDSLASGSHFNQIFADEDFTPGANLEIAVYALYSDSVGAKYNYLSSVKKIVTNSLFESVSYDVQNNTDDPNVTDNQIVVANPRHLQNLDVSVSSLGIQEDSDENDVVWDVYQSADIDWSETKEFNGGTNPLPFTPIDPVDSNVSYIENYYGTKYIAPAAGSTGDERAYSSEYYVIDNLLIKEPSGEEPSAVPEYSGLFREFKDGSLNNIYLVNPQITTNATKAVGALVGKAEGTAIKGCHVYVETEKETGILSDINTNKSVPDEAVTKYVLTATTSSSDVNVGGLVGMISGNAGKISSSSASWISIIANNVTNESESFVGGLVGSASGTTISGCYADTGRVFKVPDEKKKEIGKQFIWTYGKDGETGISAEKSIVGGLLGKANTVVVGQSYSMGHIAKAIKAGGFAGAGSLTIPAESREDTISCYSYVDLPAGRTAKSSNYGFMDKSEENTVSGTNYRFWKLCNCSDSNDPYAVVRVAFTNKKDTEDKKVFNSNSWTPNLVETAGEVTDSDSEYNPYNSELLKVPFYSDKESGLPVFFERIKGNTHYGDWADEQKFSADIIYNYYDQDKFTAALKAGVEDPAPTEKQEYELVEPFSAGLEYSLGYIPDIPEEDQLRYRNKADAGTEQELKDFSDFGYQPGDAIQIVIDTTDEDNQKTVLFNCPEVIPFRSFNTLYEDNGYDLPKGENDDYEYKYEPENSEDLETDPETGKVLKQTLVCFNKGNSEKTEVYRFTRTYNKTDNKYEYTLTVCEDAVMGDIHVNINEKYFTLEYDMNPGDHWRYRTFPEWKPEKYIRKTADGKSTEVPLYRPTASGLYFEKWYAGYNYTKGELYDEVPKKEENDKQTFTIGWKWDRDDNGRETGFGSLTRHVYAEWSEKETWAVSVYGTVPTKDGEPNVTSYVPKEAGKNVWHSDSEKKLVPLSGIVAEHDYVTPDMIVIISGGEVLSSDLDNKTEYGYKLSLEDAVDENNKAIKNVTSIEINPVNNDVTVFIGRHLAVYHMNDSEHRREVGQWYIDTNGTEIEGLKTSADTREYPSTYYDASDNDVFVLPQKYDPAAEEPTSGKLLYKEAAGKGDYDFTGWSLGEADPDALLPGNSYSAEDNSYVVEFFANWTVKEYTVSFDPNRVSVIENTLPAPIDVKYSESVRDWMRENEKASLEKPEADGFLFKGWYRDAGNKTQYLLTRKVYDDTTVYAGWDRAVKVYFDLNLDKMNLGEDIVVQEFDPQDVRQGAHVISPSDPVIAGLVFEGWYTQPVGGRQWDFDNDVVNEENITLYAHWRQTFTVSFSMNGMAVTNKNDFRFVSVVVESGQTVFNALSELEYSLSDLPQPVTDLGYNFTGKWCTADGTLWDFVNDPVTEDTMLFAQWDDVRCRVTFHANYKDGTDDVVATRWVVNGGKVLPPADPLDKLNLYNFVSWHTKNELGHMDTEPWDFRNSVVSGDMDLYAEWIEKALDYSVTVQMVDFTFGYTSDEVTMKLVLDKSNPGNVVWKANNPANNPPIPNGWISNIHVNIAQQFLFGKSLYDKAKVFINGTQLTRAEIDDNDILRYNQVKGLFGTELSAQLTDIVIPQKMIDGDILILLDSTDLNGYMRIRFDLGGVRCDPNTVPKEQAVDYSNLMNLGMIFGNTGFTVEEPPVAPYAAGYDFEGWYADAAYTQKYEFGKKDLFDYIYYRGTSVNDYLENLPPLLRPAFLALTMTNFTADSEITVYAKMVKQRYDVSFDMNGMESENGEIASQTIEYGEFVAEPGEEKEPKAQGYIFDGWCTDPEGTQEFSFNTIITGDVTLYARWTPELNTISFSMNGKYGTAPNPAAITVLSGKTISEVFAEEGITFTEPSADGFTFTGKWVDKENGEEWNLDRKVNRNMTLLAQWSQFPGILFDLSIERDSKTGEGPDYLEKGYRQKTEIEEIQKNEEKGTFFYDLTNDLTGKPVITADPEWITKGAAQGIFGGWYRNPDFTGTPELWLAEGLRTVDLGYTDYIALYPKWELQVVFDRQFDTIGVEDEGEISTETVLYKGRLNYIDGLDDPYAEGYYFCGWNEAPEGKGIWHYEIGEESITKPMTLYAVWQETPRVSFDTSIQGPDYKDYNGGSYPTDHVEDADVDKYQFVFDKPNPTWTGAEFVGWHLNKDLTDETLYKRGSVLVIEEGAGNVVLYPEWKINVSFAPALNEHQELQKEGYWIPYGSSVSEQENYKVPAFSEPGAVRGYVFRNWTIRDGDGTPYTMEAAAAMKLVAPTEFDAVWEQIPTVTYDVSYAAIGADYGDLVNHADPQLVDQSENGIYYHEILPSFSETAEDRNPNWPKTEITFRGWFTDKELKIPSNGYKYGDTIRNIQESITLYPKWTVNVTFNKNSPVETDESEERVIAAVYNRPIEGAPVFVRSGYKFTGWNESPDGTGRTWDIEKDPAVKPVTLYALWEEDPDYDKYIVRFYNYEGSYDAETRNYTQYYEQELPIDAESPLTSNTFIKEDAVFLGWSDAENVFDVKYTDCANVKLSEKAGETVNLYAQWGPMSYTATFECNGGDVKNPAEDETRVVEEDGKVTVTKEFKKGKELVFPIAQKPGYIFSGWEVIDGELSWTMTIESVFNGTGILSAGNGNVTFRAIWEEIPDVAVSVKGDAYKADDGSDNRLTAAVTIPGFEKRPAGTFITTVTVYELDAAGARVPDRYNTIETDVDGNSVSAYGFGERETQFTVLLDGMGAGEHFRERFPNITPGANIEVECVVRLADTSIETEPEEEEAKEVRSVGSAYTNSLYGYDNTLEPAKNNTSVARIGTPRQLQNLDRSAFGNSAICVTDAVQYRDIIWNNENTPAFVPISNSKLASYSGENHSISNLHAEIDDNAGLFGTVRGSMSVSNLTLADCAFTSDTGNAGTVIGSVAAADPDAKISLESVYAFTSDRKVSAADSAGGLIGSVSNGNVTIKNCASTELVSAGHNAGGLVGTQNNGSLTISNSFVGGHTVSGTGKFSRESYNISSSGNAGGLVGSASDGVAVAISKSFGSVSVKGSSSDGIIVGRDFSGREDVYSCGLIDGVLGDPIRNEDYTAPATTTYDSSLSDAYPYSVWTTVNDVLSYCGDWEVKHYTVEYWEDWNDLGERNRIVTVSFDLFGTVTMPSEGEEITDSVSGETVIIPSKAAYDLSWKLDSSSNTFWEEEYDCGEVVTKCIGDAVFVANRTPRPYEIQYKNEQGTELVFDLKEYYISSKSEPLPVPSEDQLNGKIYRGWRVSKTNEEDTDFSWPNVGEVVTRIPANAYGNVTLTLVADEVYKATFTWDGDWTGHSSPVTVSYNVTDGSNEMIPIPDVKGRHFDHWTVTPSTTYDESWKENILDDGTLRIPNTGKIPAGRTGNITFKAVWRTYQATYLVPNDADITGTNPEPFYNGAELSLPVPTRPGWSFTGWKVISESGNENPESGESYLEGNWVKYVDETTGDYYQHDPSSGYLNKPGIDKYGDVTFEATWNHTEYIVILRYGVTYEETRKYYYDGEPITLPDSNGVNAINGWKVQGVRIGENGRTDTTRTTGNWGDVGTLYYSIADKYADSNLDYIVLQPVTQSIIDGRQSITFYDRGEIVYIDNYMSFFGDIKTVPAQPSRGGFTFKGWQATDPYWARSEIGTVTGATYRIPAGILITGDIVFNAVWEPDGTYLATFEGNHGTISGENPVEYSPDQAISVPSVSRAGYDLKWWEVTSEDAGSWETGDIFTGNSIEPDHYGNVTLTAQWTPTQYRALFVDKVGENEKVIANVLYNIETGSQNVPVDPVKAGYTFLGWKLKTEVGPWETSDADIISEGIPAGKYGNVTFVAQWKENPAVKFTAYFDPNGGTVGASTEEYSVEFTAGDTVSFEIPSREGYKFLGWQAVGDTDFEPFGSWIEDHDYTKSAPDAYGDVWFKAHWSKIYTAKFWLDEEDIAPDSAPFSTVSFIKEETLNLPIPEKDGFTFLGWKVIAPSDTPLAGCWELKNIYKYEDAPIELENVFGNVTFLAQWAGKYTATFEDEQGNTLDSFQFTAGTMITLPSMKADGYSIPTWKVKATSDEWQKDAEYESETGFTALHGDVTFVGTKEACQYTATFKYNGGNGTPKTLSFTVEDELSLPIPTRTGYDFMGWSVNGQDCWTEIKEYTYTDGAYTSTPGTGKYGNVTFDAIWSDAAEYSITFNLNGGKLKDDESLPEKYTIADTVLLPIPEKAGYTFSGWKVTSANGNWTEGATISEISKGKYGIITLTAQWKPLYGNVRFAFRGENGEIQTIGWNRKYTVGEEKRLIVPSLPVRAGYKVSEEWKLYVAADDGSSVMGDVLKTFTNVKDSVVLDQEYVDGKNYIIVGEYVEAKRSIEFHNGSTKISTVYANDEDQLSSIKTPTPAAPIGKVFVGWYSDADLTNPVDFPGSKTVKELQESGVIKVYAKFVDEEYYTVTVDFMYQYVGESSPVSSGEKLYPIENGQRTVKMLKGKTVSVNIPESRYSDDQTVYDYRVYTDKGMETTSAISVQNRKLQITASADTHYLVVYKISNEVTPYWVIYRFGNTSGISNIRNLGTEVLSNYGDKPYDYTAYNGQTYYAPNVEKPSIPLENFAGYTRTTKASDIIIVDGKVIVEYSRKHYTLTYNPNSGLSVSPVNMELYIGESLTSALSKETTREDFVFGGWSLYDATASNPSAADKSKGLKYYSTMPANNIVAVANWDKEPEVRKTASLKVNLYYETANNDLTKTVYDSAPSKVIYEDIAVSTVVSYSAYSAYAPDDHFTFDYAEPAEVTIQAEGENTLNVYFRRKHYTLTLIAKVSTGSGCDEVDHGDASVIVEFKYGTNIYSILKDEHTYTAEDGTPASYTYKTWKVTSGPSNLDGLVYDVSAASGTILGTDNITLKTTSDNGTLIHYYLSKKDVTINGTGDCGSDKFTESSTERTNKSPLTYDQLKLFEGFECYAYRKQSNSYVQIGESTEITPYRPPIGTAEYYIYYVRKNYQLTLQRFSASSNAFEVSASSSVSVPYGNTLSNYADANYDWYLDSAFSIPIDSNTMPASSMIIYGYPKEVKVSFNEGLIASVSLRYGMNLTGKVFNAEDGTLKPAYVPAENSNGEMFTGWHIGSVDGELLKADTIVSSDITVYAAWTSKTSPDADNKTVTVEVSHEFDGKVLTDAQGKELIDTYEKQPVGSVLEVIAKDIPGYRPESSVKQFTVEAADGTTKVDLTYNYMPIAIEQWDYKVDYYARFCSVDSDSYYDVQIDTAKKTASNLFETVTFVMPTGYENYRLVEYEVENAVDVSKDGNGTLTFAKSSGTPTVAYYLEPNVDAVGTALELTGYTTVYNGAEQRIPSRMLSNPFTVPLEHTMSIADEYTYYDADGEEVSPKAAGSYKATGSVVLTVDDRSFILKSQDLVLSVAKRDVSFTSVSVEKAYDGTAFVPSEEDISVSSGENEGLADKDAVVFAFVDEVKRTAAGIISYTFTPTIMDSDGIDVTQNYNITCDYGTVGIYWNYTVEYVWTHDEEDIVLSTMLVDKVYDPKPVVFYGDSCDPDLQAIIKYDVDHDRNGIEYFELEPDEETYSATATFYVTEKAAAKLMMAMGRPMMSTAPIPEEIQAEEETASTEETTLAEEAIAEEEPLTEQERIEKELLEELEIERAAEAEGISVEEYRTEHGLVEDVPVEEEEPEETVSAVEEAAENVSEEVIPEEIIPEEVPEEIVPVETEPSEEVIPGEEEVSEEITEVEPEITEPEITEPETEPAEPAVCAHENTVIDAAVEATCTATGLTEGVHCADCGEILVPQEIVPMTEHSVEIDEMVAPTETEEGLTRGKHCAVCGEILVPQEKIDSIEVQRSIAEAEEFEQHILSIVGLEPVRCTYSDSAAVMSLFGEENEYEFITGRAFYVDSGKTMYIKICGVDPESELDVRKNSYLNAEAKRIGTTVYVRLYALRTPYDDSVNVSVSIDGVDVDFTVDIIGDAELRRALEQTVAEEQQTGNAPEFVESFN